MRRLLFGECRTEEDLARYGGTAKLGLAGGAPGTRGSLVAMPKEITGFRELIEAYAPGVSDFFFIQVGANDGRSGDPLFRHVVE